MFSQGQRVGVAISGGADSVCLLHVLLELAPALDLTLAAVHVNHGLRGAESDADEAFVRDLAARLKLPFHCHAADVRGISINTGDNLEQAARRVRHEFFARLRAEGALDRVALGHTRSDQAETVLFRFLRGAGTAGLAGIRPLTRDGLVRPLIEVGRAEVRQFLAASGISWREDASNDDLGFARNRIRHQILPVLERDCNPALEPILAGMARVALDEEQYWDRLTAQLAADHFLVRASALLFRAAWLASLEPAIGRRMARRAIETVKGDLRGVDLSHIDQVLQLASPDTPSGRLQLPGLDVFRSFDWFRLAAAGDYGRDDRDYQVQLPAPAPDIGSGVSTASTRVAVPGTPWEVELEWIPNPPAGPGPVDRAGPELEDELLYNSVTASGYNGGESELDWGRIAGAGKLELRNWRPGDQYRPVGHTSETKIKSLFQAARVPLWDRRRWPLITSGDEIVWVAQFGPAAHWAAVPQTPTVLRIRELGDIGEFCSRQSENRRLIGKESAPRPQAGTNV